MSISELAELVRRAQAGDAAALADLLRQIEPMIYYTALKMVGNVPDAEDLTQEAYVKVLEGLPSLRDPMTAPKWVKTIVVNLCRNQWKKKRPELFRTDEEEREVIGNLPEDETAAVPDLYMDMAAKRQIITRMIDALPEKQKLTVYLYYYDELTVEEIAQLMEVSTGTVKSRLSAARATLKAQVEEEERKGNKLYVIFPFLGRLLQEEAESLPLPPVPAAILERTGFKAAKSAGVKAAKQAARSGAGIGVKVAAGAVAAAVVVGAAVGIPAALRSGAGAPAVAPTQVVQPTPPPTPTETVPPTPSAAVEVQSFDPAAILGGSIDDLIALRGQPESTSAYGDYREEYVWRDPWMSAQVETATGTVEQMVLPEDVSLLGLRLGSSQADAQAVLPGFGPNYMEYPLGGAGVLLYNASEDHSLVCQINCADGAVVSIVYERDTFMTYGRDAYTP